MTTHHPIPRPFVPLGAEARERDADLPEVADGCGEVRLVAVWVMALGEVHRAKADAVSGVGPLHGEGICWVGYSWPQPPHHGDGVVVEVGSDVTRGRNTFRRRLHVRELVEY